MNKVTKYVFAVMLVLIVAYVGWSVISTIFSLDAWFQEDPQRRTLFNFLVIIGIIGVLAGLVETKRR